MIKWSGDQNETQEICVQISSQPWKHAGGSGDVGGKPRLKLLTYLN